MKFFLSFKEPQKNEMVWSIHFRKIKAAIVQKHIQDFIIMIVFIKELI